MTDETSQQEKVFEQFNSNIDSFWDQVDDEYYMDQEFTYSVNDEVPKTGRLKLLGSKLVLLTEGQQLVAELKYAQLTWDSKGLCHLQLTRRGFQLMLGTEDPRVITEWVNCLRKICILTEYNQVYHTVKLIGKGSFAKVYLSEHRESKMQFAVKSFQKEQGILSLRNEVDILRLMDHPGVVRLFEVYETPNYVFLVTELVTGGDILSALKKSGSISSSQFKSIVVSLLKAIQYIHQKGCMHRDLKPENILVRSCEENLWDIAVADFGLATFKTGIPLFKRCGTPGFVAPEILLYTESKDFYDEKCDIFSAGAILYMLLVGIGEGSIKLIQTGRPPFTGTDQQKVLQANKLGDPNFNDPQIIASSPKLQALLRNMLQKDPLQRYSALQCLEDPFLIGDQMASLVSHQKELEPLARICSNSIVQEQIDYHPKLIRSDQLPDSLQFRVRRPALNGEVYTVDSLSNKSNNSVNSVGSNQIADVPKQRISRFSQHHRVPAQDQEFNSLQKNFRNPRQDQLHKLAIKNSFRKKMKTVDFQFDSPRPELDPFPIEEENSEVHALMKKANSRLNQIKLSDLINREGFSNIPKAFTPRAKKYEFKF